MQKPAIKPRSPGSAGGPCIAITTRQFVNSHTPVSKRYTAGGLLFLPPPPPPNSRGATAARRNKRAPFANLVLKQKAKRKKKKELNTEVSNLPSFSFSWSYSRLFSALPALPAAGRPRMKALPVMPPSKTHAYTIAAPKTSAAAARGWSGRASSLAIMSSVVTHLLPGLSRLPKNRSRVFFW